jgi:hypothetical protein
VEVTVLHKMHRLRGFHILAADGEIGHVDEFLVDEDNWSVQYRVVEIRRGPSVETADIALIETLPAVWIM